MIPIYIFSIIGLVAIGIVLEVLLEIKEPIIYFWFGFLACIVFDKITELVPKKYKIVDKRNE